MTDVCPLCRQPLTTPVPYLHKLSTLVAQSGPQRWHYGCVWQLGRTIRP